MRWIASNLFRLLRWSFSITEKKSVSEFFEPSKKVFSQKNGKFIQDFRRSWQSFYHRAIKKYSRLVFVDFLPSLNQFLLLSSDAQTAAGGYVQKVVLAFTRKMATPLGNVNHLKSITWHRFWKTVMKKTLDLFSNQFLVWDVFCWSRSIRKNGGKLMRWNRITKFARIFPRYGTVIKSSLSTGWDINGDIMNLQKTKFTQFVAYWRQIPSRLARVDVELEHFFPKHSWYAMSACRTQHILMTLTATNFISARQFHSRKEIQSLYPTRTHFKWVLFVINLITLDFPNSYCAS